jgi:hypothetical protein
MIHPTPTNYSNEASVASRDVLDGTQKSNKYKKLIYEQICLYGPHGSTCDEIEARFGIRHQTASCFITVLQREQRIVAAGFKRPARSGREVTVYVRKVSTIPAPVDPELFTVKPTFRKEF